MLESQTEILTISTNIQFGVSMHPVVKPSNIMKWKIAGSMFCNCFPTYKHRYSNRVANYSSKSSQNAPLRMQKLLDVWLALKINHSSTAGRITQRISEGIKISLGSSLVTQSANELNPSTLDNS